MICVECGQPVNNVHYKYRGGSIRLTICVRVTPRLLARCSSSSRPPSPSPRRSCCSDCVCENNRQQLTSHAYGCSINYVRCMSDASHDRDTH
eukprot:2648813-Rhodomonas_salina.1